jgi:hypothetical protein
MPPGDEIHPIREIGWNRLARLPFSASAGPGGVRFPKKLQAAADKMGDE